MLTNLEGTRLDAYRLTRRLGGGAFGDVYLAEDLHRSTQNTQNTQVAIKVMESLKTQEAVQQFLREVRALVRLHHPHIIPIRDFGVDEKIGIPFIVMEYAPNGSLRQLHLRGTQVPLETIVSYIQQIADALQHAHEDNFVHCDVKPDNVLIGPNNELLLSDFGIASFSSTLKRNMDLNQAAPQEVVGTPSYMAPEHCQGHPEKTSDQYALAIMTYEWLCGRCPFNGNTLFDVYYQHINVAPQPLHELVPSVPPQIETVVMKALAKAPKDRYASISDFAADLETAYQQHLKNQKTKEQWFEEGKEHYKDQRYKEAIADFSHAIELDPNYANAYVGRGIIYSELKQFDHAIADLTRAIELKPNVGTIYGRRGYAYNELKQFDRAIADCTHAIELDSKLAPAYSNRGAAYYELKQFDRAISDCTRAIEFAPNIAVFHYVRGFVYEQTKQYWQALQDYMRALELDPNDKGASNGKERVKKILKL